MEGGEEAVAKEAARGDVVVEESTEETMEARKASAVVTMAGSTEEVPMVGSTEEVPMAEDSPAAGKGGVSVAAVAEEVEAPPVATAADDQEDTSAQGAAAADRAAGP